VIDWDLLFHGKRGLCKIHTNLISQSGTASTIISTWNNLIGTVRGNFQSIYSNNTQGLTLVNLTPNPVAGSTTVYYYTGISESNQAPLINIPNGKSLFTIQMLNTNETSLLTNVPNYSVLLFFEWIAESDVDKNFLNKI